MASALADGDCTADVLRTGGRLARSAAWSSTLTFLRSWWGHVRQLDRVSRELLAGMGDWGRTRPGRSADSTICETYGLDKEGARHHGSGSGAITRCWPSPPAPATC